MIFSDVKKLLGSQAQCRSVGQLCRSGGSLTVQPDNRRTSHEATREHVKDKSKRCCVYTVYIYNNSTIYNV